MYSENDGGNKYHFNWNTKTTPSYTNWAADEPNNKGGKCVGFHLKDQSGSYKIGQWYSNNCNFRKAYFCKKPTELTSQLLTSTPTPGCPQVLIFKIYF